MLAVGAALVPLGCSEASVDPLDDAGVDAGEPLPPPPTDLLDLLFVIDNSGSMAEEQASLAAEIPDLVAALSTGDHDGDGAREAASFRSIQVGIVTSDMGTGGFTVPSCARSDFGDDGVLRTQGRPDMTGCQLAYPPILRFEPGAREDDAFARDVTCVLNMGTGGCGFEQQLEATLKAVTPRAVQPWTSSRFVPIGTEGAPHGLDRSFFRMSPPHGDGANAGFVREGSMLAIVIATDEEDCSAHDPEVFNPSSPWYSATDLNLRCFRHGEEALHPPSRYVHGLLQLRPHPSRLAVLLLAGVPLDLASSPGAPTDWERLISDDERVRDPRMVEQIDTAMPNRLVPSCNTVNGIAFPPVRMTRVARGLDEAGARVAVASICQDSFAGPMQALLSVLSR